MPGRVARWVEHMDARLNAPRRPLDAGGAPADTTDSRPRATAAAIGALIVAAGAGGFLVTSLIPNGGVGQAERATVALTTTLDSGAKVAGTGVILTSSGEVVTAYNVVNGAVSIEADVGGSPSRYAATTFALSPTNGVAVLQLLNASGLPSASIGTSSHIKIGDHVTAIGRMARSAGTAADTQGAVVALGQTIVAADPDGASPETLQGVIAFSAPLPGNGSGGPLIDTSGKLIGLDVTSAVAAQEAAGTAGDAFAIPIDRVLSIVHDVNTHTEAPDILQGHGAYLGIEVRDSATPPGALVVVVGPGTPAEVARIAPHDVIVSIDGLGIDSVAALHAQLQRHHGGDYVVVGWIDPAEHQHIAAVQLAAATFT
jgi:S1-C subfamily serine protease